MGTIHSRRLPALVSAVKITERSSRVSTGQSAVPAIRVGRPPSGSDLHSVFKVSLARETYTSVRPSALTDGASASARTWSAAFSGVSCDKPVPVLVRAVKNRRSGAHARLEPLAIIGWTAG